MGIYCPALLDVCVHRSTHTDTSYVVVLLSICLSGLVHIILTLEAPRE